MEEVEIQQTEGYIEKALQQYTVDDSMIEGFKEKFMALKVEGVDDKKGYDLVHKEYTLEKNVNKLVKRVEKLYE